MSYVVYPRVWYESRWYNVYNTTVSLYGSLIITIKRNHAIRVKCRRECFNNFYAQDKWKWKWY